METVALLKKLCVLPAVSGFEKKAAEEIAKLFEPFCDTVEIDKHGNVIAFRKSKNENAKTILLDAHLDQIGFLVSEVLENGFLRFVEVGGVDPRMLLGNEVTILADEPIYGIISCMPPHLLKAGEQDKAIGISEMVIDTGLIDAKKKIKIGTPIVFNAKPISLSKDTLTSPCLDDRAGIASILLAVEKLAEEENAPCNVAVLISVQEEVTGLGAQTGTFAVRPEYGIAVDVTHGKTPDGPSDGVFDLASGVAIGMGPNFHRGFTNLIIKKAKAEDIPYTLEVMEGNTGTNAWTMQIVAEGVAMALLSIPEKYMHTPIETVAVSDVEATANLIYQFVCTFDGEVRA